MNEAEREIIQHRRSDPDEKLTDAIGFTLTEPERQCSENHDEGCWVTDSMLTL
jgi:hypothetical protein